MRPSQEGGNNFIYFRGTEKRSVEKRRERANKAISGSREQKIKILSLGKRENPKIFCETMDQVPPPPTHTGGPHRYL